MLSLSEAESQRGHMAIYRGAGGALVAETFQAYSRGEVALSPGNSCIRLQCRILADVRSLMRAVAGARLTDAGSGGGG